MPGLEMFPGNSPDTTRVRLANGAVVEVPTAMLQEFGPAPEGSVVPDSALAPLAGPVMDFPPDELPPNKLPSAVSLSPAVSPELSGAPAPVFAEPELAPVPELPIPPSKAQQRIDKRKRQEAARDQRRADRFARSPMGQAVALGEKEAEQLRTAEAGEKASLDAQEAAVQAAEAAGKKEALETEAGVAAQQRVDDERMTAVQKVRGERDRIVAEKQQQLDGLREDIDNDRIDGGRLWDNAGAFGQMAIIAGGAIGGLLAVTTFNGRNLFMETLENTIERDIRLQEKELDKKERGLAFRQNALIELKDEFGSKEAAVNTLFDLKLRQADREMQRQLLKVGGNERAVANSAAARAAIAERSAQYTRAGAEAWIGQINRDYERRAAVAARAAAAAASRRAAKAREIQAAANLLEARAKLVGEEAKAQREGVKAAQEEEDRALKGGLREVKRGGTVYGTLATDNDAYINKFHDEKQKLENAQQMLSSLEFYRHKAGPVLDSLKDGPTSLLKSYFNGPEGQRYLTAYTNYLRAKVKMQDGARASDKDIEFAKGALPVDTMLRYAAGAAVDVEQESLGESARVLMADAPGMTPEGINRYVTDVTTLKKPAGAKEGTLRDEDLIETLDLADDPADLVDALETANKRLQKKIQPKGKGVGIERLGKKPTPVESYADIYAAAQRAQERLNAKIAQAQRGELDPTLKSQAKDTLEHSNKVFEKVEKERKRSELYRR